MTEAMIVSSARGGLGEVSDGALNSTDRGPGHEIARALPRAQINDVQLEDVATGRFARRAATKVAHKGQPRTAPSLTDRTLLESQWAGWFQAAMAGDAAAYRKFLGSVTPFVRAIAKRRCVKLGTPIFDAEDIVQEVLLAIHLKRGTWNPSRPIGPWISAIARNKVVDSFRRRRHVDVPVEDYVNTLVAEEPTRNPEPFKLERMLKGLKEVQRKIVTSVSIEGMGIRQTANSLGMTEGAVRVALHRALKSLAAFYRDE